MFGENIFLFDIIFHLDPIWLIASVEEGGLMGITQQLEQVHSLGMNVNQPQQMISQMGIPPSNNLLYQTSPTNPFQSTRCIEMIGFLFEKN